MTRYKDELDSIEVPLVLADPIKGKVPGCFNKKCVYSWSKVSSWPLKARTFLVFLFLKEDVAIQQAQEAHKVTFL